MTSLGFKEISIKAYKDELRLKRNKYGIPCIKGNNYPDLFFGLGWITALDRLVALELTRLIAKGRAAEYLDPNLLNLDIIMRRYYLWGDSVSQVKELEKETLELLEAYCAGVNNRLSSARLPFEFKLIGYKPEPWTPADCILMTKMIGIVDLTETQGWMEKLIIQMLQQGVSVQKLKELFPYMTEEPDEDYLEIIRKVKLPEPIVPETVKWAVLPRLQCSNNWAVSAHKSASGQPILCGDVHLDTARLPNVFQEAIMQVGEFFAISALVPGIPFPALGRKKELAWSPTYGFMDVVDYFIEDVKDKHYRKGNRWLPFTIREESIKVKKGQQVTVRYYENEHGVLEQEPNEDGYYLCFAWSARRDSGAETLNNFRKIFFSTTVREAMEGFAHLDFTSFNWVLADQEGNIGYQMSGRSPVRPEGSSGLLPLPGWEEKNDWRGYHERKKNPSLYNPPENYIVTANQDLNSCAEVNVINLAMAPYRSRRIAELLEVRDDHSVESMKQMHYDLYSKQAELFMARIKPLLPDSENGRLLQDWDLCYQADSLGASLFENIYRELSEIVFGNLGLGPEVFNYLVSETILFHDFYGNFDRLMLSDDSAWFEGRASRSILEEAIEKGLSISPKPYGRERKIMMKNLLFGGRLPKFMGFDYGPIELPGCRATIPQGQIFNSFGRQATFSPSHRFIADFSEDAIHSNLAGGPTDRRFSRWYTSGVKDWLAGRYQYLHLQ